MIDSRLHTGHLRRILPPPLPHSVSSLRGGAENGIKKIVVDGALPPTLTWQDLSRKRSSFSSKSNRRKRIKHADYRFYRFELDTLAGYFRQPGKWKRGCQVTRT